MLKLYNSLTKQKETFRTLAEEKTKTKKVTMYNCGPTVYDYVHIGNLRSFLVADLLRRFLEFKSYKVKQVMPITDVGHMVADAEVGTDKMELAASREKKTPWQIAEFYTKAFFHDLDTLGFERAWKYSRATDHIKEMIKIVEKLFDNGYAYKVNGSVYFDLSKFPKYGQLSGNTVQDLMAGASGRAEKTSEKRNPYDFALWIEDPNHLMQWKAPWSIKAGYPGWHLECSTISMKYLGETIDIHTGGEDNKFPHHECEIAQSEGATGKQFARYWLHIKHLLVEGEKMSKSKGNFYTLNQILEKGYSPRAVRYLLLSTHYRDPLNFTFDGLKAAETVLQRLDEVWTKLCEAKGEKNGNSLASAAGKARAEFSAALDDDLNISGALAAVFNFLRQINAALAKGVSKKELSAAKNLLKELDRVLGLGLKKIKEEKISQEIKNLLEKREQARKNKDWVRADEARREIENIGYLVDDTPDGPKLKKKI